MSSPERINAMTLTEFVLARIAEDEAEAHERQEIDDRRWAEIRAAGAMPAIVILRTAEPAFTLAECAAKRAIVERHHPSPEYDRQACVLCQWDVDCDGPVHGYQFDLGRRTEWPCETILALAGVYADHPDYAEEWRS